MIYFCSDPHFEDPSAASASGMTVEKRLEKIIRNLQCVNKKDKLFVLGDVGNNKKPDALKHWQFVNGVKDLVEGNHDLCQTAEYLKYFHKIYGVVKYKNFMLSHIPLHPTQLRGRINVHGHMHNGHVMVEYKGKMVKDPRYINVNLDQTGLHPVSWDQLIGMVDTKFLKKFKGFENWKPF